MLCSPAKRYRLRAVEEAQEDEEEEEAARLPLGELTPCVPLSLAES